MKFKVYERKILLTSKKCSAGTAGGTAKMVIVKENKTGYIEGAINSSGGWNLSGGVGINF